MGSADIDGSVELGRMNLSPTDILDVSGATYTYRVSGQPPAAN